jgi:hypothetical protein
MFEKIITSRWTVGLAIFVVMMLTISTALNLLTPPPIDKQNLIISDISINTKFEFDYDKPPLPTQLQIFESQPTLSLDQLAIQVVSDLNLTPIPELPGYWANNSQTEVLNTRADRALTFNKTYQNGFLSSSGDSSPALASQNAQEFVDNLEIFSDPEYHLSAPIPQVFNESETRDPASPKEANVYKFELSYSIGKIPFVTDTNGGPPVLIWSNLDGNIFKADFYPQNNKLVAVAKLNSLSWKTIEKKLNSGLVTYLSIQEVNPFAPTANEHSFSEVILADANLEYRINPTNNLVIPYIRFMGLAVSKEGFKYQVNLITPAVPTQ